MKLVKILIILIIIAFAIGFAYAIYRKSPNVERKSLVQEVSVLMDLPKDEEPTMASVENLDDLKDQSFFRKAKIGDKVLIYTRSKMAILYRPVDNKIIEVGIVNISDFSTPTPQATETPIATSSASPKNTVNPTPTGL